MRPFQYLDLPALMDMLAYVTSRYTKMFSNNMDATDYLACRELLVLLQSEVQARKNATAGPDGNNQERAYNISI